MSRIKLSETGIENLESFHWVDYFEYNNQHLLNINYRVNNELTDAEKLLITPSIRAFQLGEGSEGKHLKKLVNQFADKTDYPEYKEIMRWFITEENRHSATLRKYMNTYHIAPISRLWLDNIFRLIRKLIGLECEIIVLVTAEMIALSYYDALANTTNSTQLKSICAQMLNDELKHVIMQSDTLHKISKNRNKVINHTVRIARRLLMRATVFVVWHKYKALFIKGKYPSRKLKRYCFDYLNESIGIERDGHF